VAIAYAFISGRKIDDKINELCEASDSFHQQVSKLVQLINAIRPQIKEAQETANSTDVDMRDALVKLEEALSAAAELMIND